MKTHLPKLDQGPLRQRYLRAACHRLILNGYVLGDGRSRDTVPDQDRCQSCFYNVSHRTRRAFFRFPNP